jgi:hypothetical protein
MFTLQEMDMMTTDKMPKRRRQSTVLNSRPKFVAESNAVGASVVRVVMSDGINAERCS